MPRLFFNIALTLCAWLTSSTASFAQVLAPNQSAAAPTPLVVLSPGLSTSEPQSLGNRIYRSVGKDGQVVFGDRPEPEAAQSNATHFMSYSSPQAMARAQQERDYWHRQADGLRQRQLTRDQELEQARREAEYQAALVHARQDALIDRRRVVVGYRNFPPRAFGPVAPVYTSSPEAVNGRSSGFIGSGFATGR